MDSDSDASIGALSDASSRPAPKQPITARNKPTRPRFLGDDGGDDSDGEAVTVFGGPRLGGGRAKEVARGAVGGARRERDERSEIDAMFDDLGDLDDEMVLPPPLDLDPLLPAADRTIDPLRAPDAGDDDDPTAAGEGAKPRKKRVIVKLDEDRLLGEDGIPKLIELSKTFKLKGKGKEVEDLKRLLKMYQLWAHQMYPKTNFEETVDTIETVCRKRRMQSALRDWRVEAYGPPTKKSKPGEDDAALAAAPDGDANGAAKGTTDDAQVDFSHDPDGEMFDDSFLDDFDIDNFDAPSTSAAIPPRPSATATNPSTAAAKPLFAPAEDDEGDAEAEAAMREAQMFEEDEEAERAMRDEEAERALREVEEREMDAALAGRAKESTAGMEIVAEKASGTVAAVEKALEVNVEKAPEVVAAAAVVEEGPPEDDWDLYA